LHPKHRL